LRFLAATFERTAAGRQKTKTKKLECLCVVCAFSRQLLSTEAPVGPGWPPKNAKNTKYPNAFCAVCIFFAATFERGSAPQLARADLELEPRRCHSILKLERTLFPHS